MNVVANVGHKVADKYELIEAIAEGGMATVWRARMHGAAGFSREVAVKQIKSEFRGLRNYIDMFVEEARVGSELAHPNIVQVLDFCLENRTYYLVMEWINGVDLGQFVQSHIASRRKTPWPLIAAIGVGALRGLAAAHERRRADGSLAPVIHRDVSPHNVLISKSGIVKLTDFGLARARDRIFSLTAPGTVKGKLSYLAPEVAMGKPATPSADLFAMGSVLWEALACTRLFNAASDLEVFKKIRNCEVKPLTDFRSDVPSALASLVHRALSKNVHSRFVSARVMAHELAGVLKTADIPTDTQSLVGQAVTDAQRYLAESGPRSTHFADPTWVEIDVESMAARRVPSVEIDFSDGE